MVVCVVTERRVRRAGNLVRLVSRGRCLSRSAGRPLCATSPPPPSSIRGSTASWESRSLRRDGEEDWEEVVAAGTRPDIPGSSGEATGVVFGAPPTDEEVCAAVASIKQ
jgi:hypothetical protein